MKVHGAISVTLPRAISTLKPIRFNTSIQGLQSGLPSLSVKERSIDGGRVTRREVWSKRLHSLGP